MVNEVTNTELWPLTEEKDILHVILAYGATCGPCISTKPNYEMVSNFFEQLGNKIKFYQVNVWDTDNKEFNQVVPAPSVPTFVAFMNGVEILKEVGGRDTLGLRDLVSRMITTAKEKTGVEV